MQQSEPHAREGAEVIRLGYERYRERFKDITRRARQRFEERDWRGGHTDAFERLELRRLVLAEVIADLGRVLGAGLEDPATWAAMKPTYAEMVGAQADVELAKTFFNSATRLVFATVGVDEVKEFSRSEIEAPPRVGAAAVHRSYVKTGSTRALVREILLDFVFAVPYTSLESDAALVAAKIESAWHDAHRRRALESIAVIDAVFYRGSGAYLVGLGQSGTMTIPLVLTLVHSERGIDVDAVLTTEADVSVVFSYTRSHFQVDLNAPSQVVRMLQRLMPRKPLADLYISIGHNKHGKTEMYSSLMAHMEGSEETFDFAPGVPGMVMLVFTMPTLDYVFKLIRDEFAYPKTSTREDVMRRYQLVFEHDRAGRMVDAQEFEHLTFPRARFAPELLAELESSTASAVTIAEGAVTLHHLYVERKVRPLDLFLREANTWAANWALADYGQAIRDLATVDIFPGDFLLKNFGVTRQGRVIFYDYDELCRVRDCQFRDLPTARHDDEEMSADPWFYVGEHDVFPEEFIRFLGLDPDQRAHFERLHGELLSASWWRELKARHESGEVLDIFPYPPSKRLRPAEGQGS